MGKRKRDVAFFKQKQLLLTVKEVFSDVLGVDEELLLQLKREDWSVKFTDIVGSDCIPDRSVLKAVVVSKEEEKPRQVMEVCKCI